MYIIKSSGPSTEPCESPASIYDYNLRWFHRDQHIVDAHSDNFRIDVRLFLLYRNIVICAAVCYGQAYQRLLINQGIIIIIIIMAGMAVFNVAGYLIEERRRWPVITASPRGQGSK